MDTSGIGCHRNSKAEVAKGFYAKDLLLTPITNYVSGIMSAAVDALTSIGFEQLGLQHVDLTTRLEEKLLNMLENAKTFPGERSTNRPSRRIAERLGFTYQPGIR